MIDVNELRKGVTFELDGGLYKVVDYSHNKTGRGNANIRIKARNLLTGANIERTFNSGLSVQDVSLDFANVSYLYNDATCTISWIKSPSNSPPSKKNRSAKARNTSRKAWRSN